ncbi:hypothetical protein RhiirA5_374551 [Rhizophagus irregularis]|uniref:DUF7431 domain-containing protein n=1 Tax=Rhizophagus irregularis TaxID=588596 RepID=A0A2N0RTD8_9GLOM|nr:hypothetical protein RhiirA5_374551 [Rhizophagus irregularis]PKC66570.1 hypothetical protein RhiirA1_394400 [Rhizophagus irregularis]CAB4495774.1 unnamed protein product [Rhizophagus irregularis]CAB5211539.1 unnamed protein product [Rhizophagus irregularis]CAB5382945.1 unnamed protein product [Rhizophagus irregularis]
MSDTRIIRVIRKETIRDDLSSLIKLKITDKLSEIRKQLTYNSIIRMDSTLLFLDGDREDSNVITPDSESERDLKDIIITDSNMENTVYLKNCEFPDPEHFKPTLKLEYGRTLTPINTEIKIADKKAFTIKDIKPVKPNVTISYETVKFNSKNTWEKKITMFLNAEAELMNFGSLGLSSTNTRNKCKEIEKNFSFSYAKISKLHLKFEGLEPTEEFIDEVKEAVESKDREKLRKINKKYGQFAPTEVTLGGIVYYVNERNSNISSEQKINDVSPTIGIPVIPAVELSVEIGFGIDNSISESTSLEWKYSSCIGGLDSFDKKEWIKSLSDCKHWDCIEFREPIHIFQLLDDNLREKVNKILGKKILYHDIISFSRQLEYGEREIVDLPLRGKICETIKKKEADCSIFATIVGDEKNDFYNCQIYHPRKGNEKPKLIIHCYQKNQKRHNLKIGFMIIGYGFDFPNDENNENDDTRLEVHYEDYQNLNDQELTRFSFEQNTFFGIPVLNELNDSDKSILIGHYFLKKESTIEANVFSYNLKENKYVKLPRSFRFQVLVSGISKTYESIQFKERFMRFMRQRRYIDIESIKNVKNIEKILYISVYSANCGPVFLKQKNNEIKLKYADCKCGRTCSFCKRKSLESDIKCAYFISNKG